MRCMRAWNGSMASKGRSARHILRGPSESHGAVSGLSAPAESAAILMGTDTSSVSYSPSHDHIKIAPIVLGVDKLRRGLQGTDSRI